MSRQDSISAARHGLDRRRMLAGTTLGLAAALSAGGRAAWGLAAPGAPEDAEPRLLTNLLTRMGARTAINGRSGFVFVLDTGAGRSALAEDIAVAMGLPPGPQVRVHGVTSSEMARTADVDRIAFAGRRFSNLQMPVFSRELLAADGLLGLDVLSQFRMTFDLERRRVRLDPAGPELVSTSITFATPSRLPRHALTARRGAMGQLILTNCVVDGVPADAFVDSGAQYSIGNLALRDALATRDGPTHRVQIYGVTGQTLVGETGAARRIEIDRRRIDDPPLLFADLHAFEALGLSGRPALLIGADLLVRFTEVSLDFARSHVRFGRVRRARPL